MKKSTKEIEWTVWDELGYHGVGFVTILSGAMTSGNLFMYVLQEMGAQLVSVDFETGFLLPFAVFIASGMTLLGLHLNRQKAIEEEQDRRP